MSIYEGCKGPLCSNFDACLDANNEVRSWPNAMMLDDDLRSACSKDGNRLIEIAPERLDAANGCAVEAFDSFMPGRTRNPIKALQNRRISHKLGITYIPEERIIH